MGDRLWGAGKLQIGNRGFHQTRGDLSAADLFDGLFPSQLRLFGGESDKRAELGLVPRLALSAICAEMAKDLRRGDQLVYVPPGVLPFCPTVGVEGLELVAVKAEVANWTQCQANLGEAVAGGDTHQEFAGPGGFVDPVLPGQLGLCGARPMSGRTWVSCSGF